MLAKRDQNVILRLIILTFFDVFVAGAGYVVTAPPFMYTWNGCRFACTATNRGIRLIARRE